MLNQKSVIFLVITTIFLSTSALPTTAVTAYAEQRRDELFTTYKAVVEEYLQENKSFWSKLKEFLGYSSRQTEFLYVSLEDVRIDIRKPIPDQLSQIVTALKLAKANTAEPSFISQCSRCIEKIWFNNVFCHFLLGAGIAVLPFTRARYFVLFGCRYLWDKMMDAGNYALTTPRRVVENIRRVPEATSTPKPPRRRTPRASPNSVLRETLGNN